MIRTPKTVIRAASVAVLLASFAAVPAGAAGAPGGGAAATPRVLDLRVLPERGSAASVTRSASAPATVHVDGCTTSSVPDQRSYSVSAVANRVTGAKSVIVRFHLYYKAPGLKEEEVKILTGNRLGVWEDPVAVGSGGVSSVKFRKSVLRLASPATYRVSVDFQWYSGVGATGRRVKSLPLRAAACAQPDLRPDLRIDSAGVTRVDATTARVSVVVTNVGKGRSAAGSIRLFIPGTGPGTGAVDVPVGRIDEQGTRRRGTARDPLVLSRKLEVDVARCASGSTMTVEIDPSRSLGEQSTTNNYSQLGCLAAD